ncbi:hypothetical protein JOB18_029972 [Solea senegalensis]|uniref:Uncharacterized protein n=1 Tax=Solea senegalensis TaxID=28829 RepID=A0AAV6RTC2_SOLSE|nr:hypothetical protein JOB18_029972 [Solea senegalensis]
MLRGPRIPYTRSYTPIGVYLHGICEDPRNFVVAESKDLNQIGEGLVGIIENSRCEWFDKDGKKRWGEWTALSDTLAAMSAEPASSFTMPHFHTTEAGFSAASQITQTSTLPVNVAPGAMAAGASLTPNLPSKTATKRSPKLWPKRSTNVVPINTPAPPMGEWSAACFEAREEFPKLHEDFGKEIKKLISSWSRRGQAGEDVQEENLIDFG